jgi:glycine betaine transporter
VNEPASRDSLRQPGGDNSPAGISAASGGRGAVFFISLALTVCFATGGLVWPERLATVASAALGFTTKNFGWFYLLAANVFLAFCIYLIFSRHAHVRLGKDHERPEYSYASWLAMLFSAGMGIGLVFWGVAEPMFHFDVPPLGLAESRTPEAARIALRYSFFHWCLHPWAIYAVIALSIAYAQFRKGESSLISSTFRPLLGKRVDGPAGQAIDSLATLATVFGVATSLGLGALQISRGLNQLFGVDNSRTVQILIIGVVTVLFMISAITGLDKGILYLSNLNMVLAGALLLFILFAGPTVFILEAVTTVIGGYLQNVVQMSFRLTPFSGDGWVSSWTLFYWAWWIAWAPFVGTFIARISRGRTIREFVVGVLLVPSVLCAMWFATFGGAALFTDLFQKGAIADAVKSDMTTALFVTLHQFPWGGFLGVLAGLLIVSFFVTSADSATFVLGMLTSKGNPNPTTATKLIWGVLQSTIAAALLVSGGLKGLQTASIVVALPFAVIMLLMIVALLKALQQEPPTHPITPPAPRP